MTTIETSAYKELVGQLIKFQENQVMIIQKLADLVPREGLPSGGIAISAYPTQFDPIQDAQLSAKEAAIFGEEMTEADLAKQFGEPPPVRKEGKALNDMSRDEIESWERAQDNSNDLYKIKARVSNLARGGGAALTAQGEMLVNTYVHVLKSLYDFAENIEDSTTKIKLTQLIRKNEDMPGNLIAAAGAGVRTKK